MQHHQTGKAQIIFGFIFLGLAVLGLILGITHYRDTIREFTDHTIQAADHIHKVNADKADEERAEVARDTIQSFIDGGFAFKLTLPIYILLDIILFAIAVLMISQGYANKHLADDIQARKDQK